MKNKVLGPKNLFHVFMETFLVKNIVLVQAIGICPIIAIGINLQYGVALTLCTAAVLLPCSLFMSVFGDKVVPWARPLFYTIGASLLLVGAAYLVDNFVSHEIYAALYLFLPLMAVNTIFTYRAGGFSVSHHPIVAVVDALGSALGFGIVICIVSGLREIAIQNTLWGIQLPLDLRLPEASYPFAAFILLGFMAALLQWVKSLINRYRRADQENNTSL